jgi:hypothetical protein
VAAHARKPGMKKNFQSFPFQLHKPDTCMTISFRGIHFFILDTFRPDTLYIPFHRAAFFQRNSVWDNIFSYHFFSMFTRSFCFFHSINL